LTRAGGNADALASAAATTSGSAPNNAEVLITLLQGAALCGAAAAIAFRWHRSKAMS
jgi:hypothetical protein